MKIDQLQKIINLVWEKVNLDEQWKWIDPSVLDAFDMTIDEIYESVDEYRNKNKVFLESEIWDIFWCILRLVELLDREWAIEKDKIFDRIITKYSQRVEGLQVWTDWEQIKKSQKIELIDEQEKVNNYKSYDQNSSK